MSLETNQLGLELGKHVFDQEEFLHLELFNVFVWMEAVGIELVILSLQIFEHEAGYFSLVVGGYWMV